MSEPTDPFEEKIRQIIDASQASSDRTEAALAAIIERMGADSLDAAWAEAEAVLPENGGLRLARVAYLSQTPYGLAYSAWALQGTLPLGLGRGDTPVAALRALADKLRERGER
jgi:hypothetical protein